MHNQAMSPLKLGRAGEFGLEVNEDRFVLGTFCKGILRQLIFANVIRCSRLRL